MKKELMLELLNTKQYKTIQTITYFINGKQYCRYSLSFTTNRN